jgi:hypothetical protein
VARILDDTAIDQRLSERQFFAEEAVFRAGPPSDLPKAILDAGIQGHLEHENAWKQQFSGSQHSAPIDLSLKFGKQANS